MTSPFTCSNCGTPCDCDYLCPGCREPICDRCVHLGHEMEYMMGDYRCAGCAKEDKMIKGGGAAFPIPPITLDDFSAGIVPDERYHGMTMRQAYKMAALTGLLASPRCPGNDANAEITSELIANISSRVADSMLAEDEEFDRRATERKEE